MIYDSDIEEYILFWERLSLNKYKEKFFIMRIILIIIDYKLTNFFSK